jgi:hypothetical protein
MFSTPSTPANESSPSSPANESSPPSDSQFIAEYDVGDYVEVFYPNLYLKGLIYEKNNPPSRKYSIFYKEIGKAKPVDDISKLITRKEFETGIEATDRDTIEEYNKLLSKLGKSPYVVNLKDVVNLIDVNLIVVNFIVVNLIVFSCLKLKFSIHKKLKIYFLKELLIVPKSSIDKNLDDI